MARLIKVRIGWIPVEVPSEITHGDQLTLSDVGLTDAGALVSSGGITSSSTSQLIENKDVYVSSTTGIQINHSGVIVRNCRIRHDGGQNGINISSGLTGVIIENCEIDGMDVVLGNYGTIGVTGGPATIRRNYFKRCRAGATALNSGTKVIENWVTDLHIANGSHGNAFSYHGAGTGRDVEFLRNRVEASNSGGISFYARERAIVNCATKDNLIIGLGIGFGMYGGFTGAGSGQLYQHDNRSIVLEGNRFSGTFAWPGVVGEGTNCAVNLGQPGNTFTNNRWTDGVTDLPARCGVSQDACESDWTGGSTVAHGSDLLSSQTGLAALGLTTADLTVHSGQMYSSSDGQTIEGYDIQYSSTENEAALIINHNNVTVKGCRVFHDVAANGILDNGSGNTVEFCDIDGGHPVSYNKSNANFGNIGIQIGTNGTVRRCYITGVRDGFRFKSGCLIEEVFINDLNYHTSSQGGENAHNDGIRSDGGVSNTIIRRNRVPSGNTGGIILFANAGHYNNFDIFDNFIIGESTDPRFNDVYNGGSHGQGIYGGFTDYSANGAYVCSNLDVHIEGNLFTGEFAYGSAIGKAYGEGTNVAVNSSRPGHTWLNNKWFENSPHADALNERCGVTSNDCKYTC
jgi:hypothetical protein